MRQTPIADPARSWRGRGSEMALQAEPAVAPTQELVRLLHGALAWRHRHHGNRKAQVACLAVAKVAGRELATRGWQPLVNDLAGHWQQLEQAAALAAREEGVRHE